MGKQFAKVSIFLSCSAIFIRHSITEGLCGQCRKIGLQRNMFCSAPLSGATDAWISKFKTTSSKSGSSPRYTIYTCKVSNSLRPGNYMWHSVPTTPNPRQEVCRGPHVYLVVWDVNLSSEGGPRHKCSEFRHPIAS